MDFKFIFQPNLILRHATTHMHCITSERHCTFKDKHLHIDVFQLLLWHTSGCRSTLYMGMFVSCALDISRLGQHNTSATPNINPAVWFWRKIINNSMHRRLPIVKKLGVNKHITEWEKTLLGWLHVFSAIVAKRIKCLPMEEWDYVDCRTVYLQPIHSRLVGKRLGYKTFKKKTQTADIRASFCLFIKMVIVFSAVPQTRGRPVGDLNRQN